LPANGTNCWSVRLMWRTDGRGEVKLIFGTSGALRKA
jgi:hypothetical protein